MRNRWLNFIQRCMKYSSLGALTQIFALQKLLYRAKVVTRKDFNDARHIAIATLHPVDALVSWSFRDRVNLSRIRRIHAVNIARGLPLLAIVSPQEVVYESERRVGKPDAKAAT